MATITIKLEDSPGGTVDCNVNFSPAISDAETATPAQQVAVSMIEAVKDAVVEAGGYAREVERNYTEHQSNGGQQQ